ncbi:poly polymerase catalytic domain-containing protein [Dactylonectria estremocensis]|uniref:Poly [ADP-ribose] polymerase n=1 Tax=Dactylonectria estremocensis TaxID=1079267 RepID=A0A9P9J219_9HYPO|nr:poly polymerase catalytic domain-containing protein [Dactylonectria estremocensis]
MPPRRKAAAAPPADPPLDGCAIALSGKFDAISHSHGSLETLIRSHGGIVTKSVTKATTHVVCTEDDFNAGTAKIAAAKAKDLPLVNPRWLLDVESEKKKVDVDSYAWGTKKANGTKSKAATNGTAKKRSAVAAKADDEEEEEEESQPKTKKARASRATASKATKAAKADEEDEEEEEEEEEEVQPKAKKAKGAKAAAPKAAKATKASKAKVAVKDEPKDEPEEDLEEEKVVAEGQFIKKKGIAIPLDEHCTLPTYQVYVDPDSGLIYDASLNQSNSSNNNNKFYRIQVLVEDKSQTFKAWTRWGRVGEPGTGVALGNGTLNDAIKNFEKKFKDKSGLPWDKRGGDPKPGKYAFVERSYNPDSDDEDDDDAKPVKEEDGGENEASAPPPECTLDKPIKELMELIFNQQYFQATMSALNYDANKLPLGKLSKTTITRGFQQLKDLAALIDDPSLAGSKWNTTIAAATEHLSNTYYSFIPHAFGRNRPPIIRDDTMLKKEIELLESLSDMKDAAEIMKIDRKTKDTIHPLDRQFQGLGMEEMSPLDRDSKEFTHLSHYLNESRGSTHNVAYEIQDIFRIERQGETKRFDDSPYTKIASDRRLLWHGSRCTNFGGILSQGLRIAPPEAPVSGYMFGKGIYLADMSSKSAGYCASYVSNGHALLLLCEAELGDPMQELTNASYSAGETAKKNGMYSTWGQGSMGPSKWVDASIAHDGLKGIKMPDTTIKPGQTNVKGAGLYYNEYIVYDVAQVKLRYLFRVKM